MTKKRKKYIEIKNKFINHLVIEGKKNKSEKIVLKSFKAIQTESKKPSEQLLQLALIFNIPIFKINRITNKKRKKKKQKTKIIPAFISRKSSRISVAIKHIIKTAYKKKTNSLAQKFLEEILASSQNRSQAIEIKKETQQEVLLNHHLLKYYRWH